MNDNEKRLLEETIDIIQGIYEELAFTVSSLKANLARIERRKDELKNAT